MLSSESDQGHLPAGKDPGDDRMKTLLHAARALLFPYIPTIFLLQHIYWNVIVMKLKPAHLMYQIQCF